MSNATPPADDGRRSIDYEKHLEPVIREGDGLSFDEHCAVIEGRRATGLDRPIAGKYVSDIGPVSRRGLRRVLPDNSRGFDVEWKTERVIEAAKVLHGRNATIFEAHVIARLLGRPQRPIPELAAQFGITDKQVYKIISKCMERVRAEMQAAAAHATGASPFVTMGWLAGHVDCLEKNGRIVPITGEETYGPGLNALWRIFPK